jgi:hypothetical protein
MTRGKWFSYVLGVVTAMVFQIAAGMILVYFLSVIFSSIDVYQPMGWVVSLASIWLCFTVAIALVGRIYMGIINAADMHSYPVRFLLSTLGTLLPMIALLVLGIRTGFTSKADFSSMILDNWQPRLVSVSLALGLLGFYLPGWLTLRAERSKKEAA